MADDLLSLTVDIATRATMELMKRFRRLPPGAIGSKSHAHDLVTEADLASEEVIVSALREAFPDHALLAEESGASGAEGGPRWIIDPLDGTVNFVHGFPFFAVSIAHYRGPEPEIAVVAAPALGEIFAARRGGGAWLGGERLSVSSTGRIADAFLSTGFAYEREDTPNPNLPNFARLVYRARAVRRPGCASLDLAYTATGQFDGFWEAHLAPWDVAAGALLVREAGGRVTDFGGGESWLSGANILATNGHIHDELASYLEFDPAKEAAK
jgi:myo-inositol-1(or 4)-monophosphatase